MSAVTTEVLEPFIKRLPSKLDQSEPVFSAILQALQTSPGTSQPPFQDLATVAAGELELALATARELGKTKPLTEWKNKWLVKDAGNHYILGGTLEANRIAELANVLESYEKALANRGVYDFDDMILRAIAALEANDDLKYTLQEQYQYILLDEFQDTNKAQLRLVELLTDNPALEGRPNVLAVGDDDQAIYAFQGAQYSNMQDFAALYNEVLVVNLTENYRSTAEILSTARGIASQITDTLSNTFPGLNKTLSAERSDLPATSLIRIDYASEVAERAGVAASIRELIESGVMSSDIAVLAPKHRYLMPLVPYLDGIPLRYERRENILEAPVVRQLLTMSKLILALQQGNQALADSLWPGVLSYDFWKFPVSSIWQVSWQAARERKPWSELLLEHELFRPAVLLMLSLAGQVPTRTLEVMLDRLIGTEEVVTGEADMPTVRSPLRAALLAESDAAMYQTITELTVLRARLQEHEQQRGSTLGLPDLVSFVAEYELAEEQMLNTSPYSEAAEAVQLMTVFKAKGLEFAHVFLLNCQDDVWGNSSRGNSNKLTLPANLAPIRHAGATEDERLRIFFVAITRAKHGLYLTSHRATHAGKKPTRLKYLDEVEQSDGRLVSQVMPADYAEIIIDSSKPPTLEALETDWRSRHTSFTPTMRELLSERLERYQLSPTHLTTFIDLEHAGPESFLLQTLLRFPTAPSVDLVFGNAMHAVMEWLQLKTNQGQTLTTKQAVNYLNEQLQQQSLGAEQLAVQQARGEHALLTYLRDPASKFKPHNRPEYNFRDEGVVLAEGTHLGGKIDLLRIDPTARTIEIVDYKTGALGKDPAKLHRYELQLYCYKLLVEGSHTFQGYTVTGGELIFVEPDSAGKITRHQVAFNQLEQARVSQLLAAMWQRVQSLELPDITGYGSSLSAIKQFEQDLIDSYTEPAR